MVRGKIAAGQVEHFEIIATIDFGGGRTDGCESVFRTGCTLECKSPSLILGFDHEALRLYLEGKKNAAPERQQKHQQFAGMCLLNRSGFWRALDRTKAGLKLLPAASYPDSGAHGGAYPELYIHTARDSMCFLGNFPRQIGKQCPFELRLISERPADLPLPNLGEI